MNKYVVRFKNFSYEYCILVEAENTIQAIQTTMKEYPQRFNGDNFEIIKIDDTNNKRILAVEELFKNIEFRAETAKGYYEDTKNDYARGINTAYEEVLRLIKKINE